MSADERRERETEAGIIVMWKVGMGGEGEMKEPYPRRAITDKAETGDPRSLGHRLAKSSINRVCGLC